MKYKCSLCGYIASESEYLEEDFRCPLCGVSKTQFDLFEEPLEVDKRVRIDEDNISINRVIEKCINCGICKRVCKEKTGISYDDVNSKCALCINCGNCILNCPTGALTPKYNYMEVLNLLSNEDKILVAFTAPAVRASLGEAFGLSLGENCEGKMVSALKCLGFSYVLDTTLGADMTIMEEVTEFIWRFKEGKNIPMFTSCCPSWVKFVEIFYPDFIPNLSTTKSPNAIMGALVKTYFAEKMGLDKDNIVTVGIVPCTSKKYECKRPELENDVDYMLTTTELAMMIREKNIDFKSLSDNKFDSLIGTGSSAGLIFGSSGGVMEASLRTLNYLITGQNKCDFNMVRGSDWLREASIEIDGNTYNVAVVYGLSNAGILLDKIKNGEVNYHFVEVMACENGCVGGAGQPLQNINRLEEYRELRLNSLFKTDEKSLVKYSHENEQVKNIYEEFLGEPGSELAHKLLHTEYSKKER